MSLPCPPTHPWRGERQASADEPTGADRRPSFQALPPRRGLLLFPATVTSCRRCAWYDRAVFLSYSGDDRELAAAIASAFCRRFQQVFDYRDQGKSIVPGRRWIDEVFDRLAASSIGVLLLSPSYFRSGNCAHEARQLMALADGGKLKIFPVKIKEGPLDLPNWMQDIQYVRGWEYAAPEKLVERIVSAYDSRQPRG